MPPPLVKRLAQLSKSHTLAYTPVQLPSIVPLASAPPKYSPLPKPPMSRPRMVGSIPHPYTREWLGINHSMQCSNKAHYMVQHGPYQGIYNSWGEGWAYAARFSCNLVGIDDYEATEFSLNHGHWPQANTLRHQTSTLAPSSVLLSQAIQSTLSVALNHSMSLISSITCTLNSTALSSPLIPIQVYYHEESDAISH